MTVEPANVPYRVEQLERRVHNLERRIDAMKFDAMLVRLDDCREDVAQLSTRMGRLQWLLVSTIATVGGSALLVAASVGLH